MSREGDRAGWAKCGTPAASLRQQPRVRGPNSRLIPLGAASPTGLPTAPAASPRGRSPPFSPSAAPFTFQQPLDDAVDIEFIYIRHRLPTTDPPVAAPPAARARDSRLLSHATSKEAVVAAVATAAAGPPPTAPHPASSFSPHWNHEKNKMAADSLASLGRRTDARGECSGPAGTSLWTIERAGGGGARAQEGGGARAREGEETVERNCDRARDPSAKRAEPNRPPGGSVS